MLLKNIFYLYNNMFNSHRKKTILVSGISFLICIQFSNIIQNFITLFIKKIINNSNKKYSFINT